ncbi:MAG: NUDIX hydrolase [Candidatus Magnetobacterium sp. LHC-1]|nr:NUDIX hydrolase [Nitrospirota bacterium]
MTKWEILGSEYVFSTKWFKIRKDRVKLPDGQIYDEYYVKERRDWAAVFCLTDDDRIILTKTYKHGSQKIIYELPSGSIEDNETPAEGIIREIREEIGYHVDINGLKKIGVVLVDPTYVQARLHIFFSRDVKKVYTPEDNPLEIFEICLVNKADIRNLIWNNLESFPESQVACILLALDYMERSDKQ